LALRTYCTMGRAAFHGLLLSVQVAFGIALNVQPMASPVAPVGLPPQMMETWELAAANQSTKRARLLEGGPSLDPYIVNGAYPGLCFAEPLESTVRKNWAKMEANIERGHAFARNNSVIFAGLIRDAEHAVDTSYKMLRTIGRQFRDYHFIVLESDSRDETVEQLEHIAHRDEKFEYHSLGRLNLGDARGLEQTRMARMAGLRNKLHSFIKSYMLRSPDWDLIALYDFDLNLFGDNVVLPHSVFNTLGRPISVWNKWDMVCANSLRHVNNDPAQRIGYHDCFAYRTAGHDAFNGYECGATIAATLFDDFHPQPVHSCFGGFALYKSTPFLKCAYDATVYDCEHVAFHRCIREVGGQGRMFMDPLLTTLYGKDIRQKCLNKKEYTPSSQYQGEMIPGMEQYSTRA